MDKEIIKYLGTWLDRLGVFSFGYWKGRKDAKKKLEKDNQHVIDMLNPK